MKIALISNVTVEVLAGMLGKEHAVWTPPGFGAWMETALDPPKEMADVQLICLLIEKRFGAFDAAVQSVERAVAHLRETFPKAAVIAPDVERLAADFGESFYDERMWKLGKMPFSLLGLRELAKLFTPKKVLAVDLDGTLWQGVIGEDGVAGVRPNAELQQKLAALKAHGVLLAILSKNNRNDVEPVWADTHMVLAKGDFVASAVDWEEKAGNLEKMARQLNLGVDSFVFVDDDPAERAAMRALQPTVTVADFPPQLDIFFPFEPKTVEDLAKTEQYRAEATRRAFGEGLSVDDYLKNLRIWSEIHPVADEEIARIAQLSQKTNQFNVCTNRYSEREIAAAAHDPERLLLSMHSGDRFGDYGLVAFVQAAVRGDSAEITDWVMSCRTMNRRLEFTMEREVERLLSARGVRTVHAKWRRTAKNAPVAGLFDAFGFKRVTTGQDERTYVKTLANGPLVSAILPCYNVAPWVGRCLDSVFAALPERGEVIAVDDASTDDTLAILLERAKTEPRLKIVAAPHEGVSAARNRGLDAANGDFVFFVDPDDAVETDFFSAMVEALERDHADCCLCGYYAVDEGTKDVRTVLPKGDYRFRTNAEIVREYLPRIYGYSMDDVRAWYRGTPLFARREMAYSWRMAFRRSVLEASAVRFDISLELNEDAMFNVEFLLGAASMTCVNRPLYRAYDRPSGAVRTLYGDGRRYCRNKLALLKKREQLDRKSGGSLAALSSASSVLSALEMLSLVVRRRVSAGEGLKMLREYMGVESVRRAFAEFPLSWRHPVLAMAVRLMPFVFRRRRAT